MAYLESKPRYQILDGLRGVAALVVVMFHLFETYSSGPVFQIINHGYLAVDFFFVLSGFVVSYAYDDRWGKMSTWQFFKRRLIRLHPMIIIGSIIGLIFFYLGSCSVFPLVNQTSCLMLILMCFLGASMFPSPKSWDIRGWQETYPLNGAQWSLLLEYFANIVYAFILRRLPNSVIIILIIIAAYFTIDLGLGIDILNNIENYSGTFIGGWGIEGEQLHIGLVRLSYPFLIGLLIARMGKFISIKNGFLFCSIIVVLCQAMPRFGGQENYICNGIYETICVLIVFPLVVAVGAGSNIKSNFGEKICKFLGDISYPLYITHYPLVYMQMSWRESHLELPISSHVLFAVGIYFLAIFIAYASFKLFDLPIREKLKKMLFK